MNAPLWGVLLLAAAGEPPAVRVIAPDCATPPVSVAAFQESLRVELAEVSQPLEVRLAVEPCHPATERIIVSVVDDASGRTIRRDVGLEDVAPDARPRALALAVAELVRSMRPPPPPADPVIRAEPRPPVPGPARLLIGAAEGELRSYPDRRTVMFGGRVSLAWARGSWQLAGYLDGGRGESRYAVGTVVVRSLNLGAVIGPRIPAGPAVVTLGLCGELGWTWIAGESQRPTVETGAGSGLTAAIRAQVGVEAPAARWLRLKAAVEGGMTALSVDGYVDGAVAAGTAGPSIVVTLGAAVAPPR
jgi:hypothetical protein